MMNGDDRRGVVAARLAILLVAVLAFAGLWYFVAGSSSTTITPDEIWNEAARHFDERALATLTLSIAMTNVWNRLNVATRQVAGEWLKSVAQA